MLFMIFDGVTKLLQTSPVVKAQAELGWPEQQGRCLGLLVLVCTAAYVIPRSAVLGAILLTAFFGLFVRDKRLRELIPLRRRSAHEE